MVNPDIVEIGQRSFLITRYQLKGFDEAFYGCGWLPLRARRSDLIDDLRRSQPEEIRAIPGAFAPCPAN